MQIEQFIGTLKSTPEAIAFSDTMAVIEAHYHFQACAFRNGSADNSADQNQGSCKLLAFAQLQGFTEAETLACFGDYYRVDVLQHQQAEDHQNIRQFMQHGWQGVSFSASQLTAK